MATVEPACRLTINWRYNRVRPWYAWISTAGGQFGRSDNCRFIPWMDNASGFHTIVAANLDLSRRFVWRSVDFTGIAGGQSTRSTRTRRSAVEADGTAKACILLYMLGGAPQQERST